MRGGYKLQPLAMIIAKLDGSMHQRWYECFGIKKMKENAYYLDL